MHGQTNKDIGKNNELPCAIIKHERSGSLPTIEIG
jgi:hypothetical protein